jgi:L-asparaginase/Glu-tRNA(Gln) amidotransferase subunit D
MRAAAIATFASPFADRHAAYRGDRPLRPVVEHVPAYPGLRGDWVRACADRSVEHLVLHGYSGGLACVGAGPYDLASAIADLTRRGVATYAVSQQIGRVDPGAYAVGKDLVDAGCVPVARLTAETLHAVLLVLAAQLPDAAAVRSVVVAHERAGG